jgi:hypothetical protein
VIDNGDAHLRDLTEDLFDSLNRAGTQKRFPNRTH